MAPDRAVAAARALILVLDSAGIGHAPDATEYGDQGANTLGHILEQAPEVQPPNLFSMGLGELVPSHRSHSSYTTYKGSYGKMRAPLYRSDPPKTRAPK